MRLYKAFGEAYTGWNMVGNEENTVGLVETRTIRVVERDQPLLLDCGKKVGPIDVAYETYGQSNEAGDNATLRFAMC